MDVPAPLPLVAILPDKFMKGASNLSDPVTSLIVTDFQTAFRSQYATDAHFITYVVTNQSTWPRLNKPVLPRIRMLNNDVLTTMVVLDYDNPNHQPWMPGQLEQFIGQLSDVAVSWPLAMRWTLFYTTKNGARLVYVLRNPVPADQSETRHEGLVKEFRQRGIHFGTRDGVVADWTRLFRLPNVTRDTQQTWLMDPSVSEYIEQLDNRVDIEELPSAGDPKYSEYAEIRQFDEPKPDREYSKSLLNAVNMGTGRMGNTEFYKAAKQRLKNRDCYACLFETKPLASVGSRGSTLLKFVGQAVALLYYLEGTRPEHIYALFLDPVLQFEPAPDVADWTDELWRFVGTCWAREESRAVVAQKKAEEQAAVAASLEENILMGMREWNRHPELYSPNVQVAVGYLERHMIASVGSTYYIIGSNGYYDPSPVTQTQLIASIRAKGLGGIMVTAAPNKDGMLVDRPIQHVISQYATVVQDIWAQPGVIGCTIDGIDTETATLKIPCYARNPELQPCYDKDVDAWLQSLFGQHYDQGCKWIAWALAFEEGPICALSLAGSAGAGKKMLVQGLAECLKQPRLATAEDMVSNYSYGLLTSPFLIVNEGWPKSGNGRQPADQFRSLVSGDPMTVNRKFMAPVKISSAVRVIFTANNLDVIKMLCHKRELSPEDREALAVRLMHFDIGDGASQHLADLKGMRHTAKPGRRWIAPDGGGESNYIVAKHFLWLYETRLQRGNVGGRFLVEGNANQEVMFEMRTQGGSSPLVIEAVLKMLESKRPYPGLAVVNGRVFIVASVVLEYFRDQMASKTREHMTAGMIQNVFRGIGSSTRVEAFTLKGQENLGRKRWHELDCEMLFKVAKTFGFPCTMLETVVKQQRDAKVSGVFMESVESSPLAGVGA